MTTLMTLPLEPGDLMCYGVRPGFKYLFEQAVQLRTQSPLYHVEVYVGKDTSISADYRGVNYFPVNLEPDRLHSIRRPPSYFNLGLARQQFDAAARGQQYDALGLIFFGHARPDTSRKICSELATLVYRWGAFWVLPSVNPKLVYPGMLGTAEGLTTVWRRDSPQTGRTFPKIDALRTP